MLDFTYNNVSLTQRLAAEGVRFTVTRIEGAGVLGAEVLTANRAGGDGSRLIGTELPERRVHVYYTLETLSPMNHASLVEQARAEAIMSGLLHRRGLHELILSFRDGHFLATPAGIDVRTRLAHYQAGTIEFVCPSPFLYGESRTVGRGSGNRVEISSNYYVEPVILWRTRIGYGAPHIEVDGQRLTIDTQVGEGQQIRIDSVRKETRIGGVLEVEHIHGTYPRLYDGSVVTIVPGGTDISFQYQERWI